MDEPGQRYFVLNKPSDMVSQFVSTHPVRLLGDLPYRFPEGTHAIGRLDSHSEGLLLLTTDKKITRLLFQGTEPHKRSYLVQVKNEVSEENISRLQHGVSIRIKTGIFYTTPACDVKRVRHPEKYYARALDIPEYHPHTWLLITLTEGKFHQVRKMVAAIHHPCKRLIRISIEDLLLQDLAPGEVREMKATDFFQALHIVAG